QPARLRPDPRCPPSRRKTVLRRRRRGRTRSSNAAPPARQPECRTPWSPTARCARSGRRSARSRPALTARASHQPSAIARPRSAPSVTLLHGYAHLVLVSELGSIVITGVHVANHAHAGVVAEHPCELLGCQLSAVGHCHLPGVDGAADADPA